MPTPIPAGQVAFIEIDTQDDAGISHHSSFSVKSLDYPHMYVVLRGATRIYFVGKDPTFTGTVTVQLSATNANGVVLPVVTLDFSFGGVVPPAATHIVPGPITVVPSDIGVPPDPGSDTITGNV